MIEVFIEACEGPALEYGFGTGEEGKKKMFSAVRAFEQEPTIRQHLALIESFLKVGPGVVLELASTKSESLCLENKDENVTHTESTSLELEVSEPTEEPIQVDVDTSIRDADVPFHISVESLASQGHGIDSDIILESSAVDYLDVVTEPLVESRDADVTPSVQPEHEGEGEQSQCEDIASDDALASANVEGSFEEIGIAELARDAASKESDSQIDVDLAPSEEAHDTNASE
jgi:hypothetical protein